VDGLNGKSGVQWKKYETRKITLSKELALFYSFLFIHALGVLAYLFHQDIGSEKLPDAPSWRCFDFVVPDVNYSALPDPVKKS